MGKKNHLGYWTASPSASNPGGLCSSLFLGAREVVLGQGGDGLEEPAAAVVVEVLALDPGPARAQAVPQLRQRSGGRRGGAPRFVLARGRGPFHQTRPRAAVRVCCQ